MSHLDRLSSLVSHFEVRANAPGTQLSPNLVIAGIEDELKTLWLCFVHGQRLVERESWICSTRLDYGGQANPVLDALPDEIQITLDEHPELAAVASLIATELKAPRCGSQFALDRLCELLLVSVLRRQIETRRSDTGVLAGLADQNLGPVLVAIHDDPGRQWRLDDFVDLSGMSRSQFMSSFQDTVGKSPIAYLKGWRMTLARNALIKGERVKEIARRFGYGSGDAFTRAFTSTFGIPPTRLNQSNLHTQSW